MNWKEYDKHLWDDFSPKWSPDWIVVAPDGFGQVMWRFMGDQDVLDVIADEPPLRHGAIIGWPWLDNDPTEQKARQKERAVQIASKAELLRR